MVHSRLLHLAAALIFLYAATPAQGQGFRKTYGIIHSQFNDVVETPDGGFFLVGTSAAQPSIFQLTDPSGKPLWATALPLNGAEPIAACQVPDGSFVALAEYYDDGGAFKNLVLKLSPAGTVQWQTPIASPNMENGLKDLLALPDGSVVVVGSARPNVANQDVRLLKINADGSLAWSKTFGEATRDEFAAQVVVAPGGGFTVGGFSTPTSSGAQDLADFFLAQTDADGNLLWQKNYPKPGTQFGFDLIRTLDGGLALAGETQQTNPVEATVLKTDASGEEQWYSRFNPAQVQQEKLLEVRSIAEDAAGNLYLPGITAALFAVDSAFVARLTPNGSVDHLKWLTYPDFAFKILYTQDGKFVLAGQTGGLSALANAAFFSKIDSLGELYGNFIAGSIYHDVDDNCVRNVANEPLLPRFTVRAENAEGEVFFAETNTSGSYKVLVPDGSFRLTAQPAFGLSNNGWAVCDTPHVVVSGLVSTVSAPSMGLRSLADCPVLDLRLSAGLMRRCTTTRFTLNYCNTGNATATGPFVLLTADEKLEYVGSSLPLAGQVGQEFRFDLDDLPLGVCGSFTADFKVSCDAALDEVLCMDAHIFPDSLCPLPGAAAWDGSNIVVEGKCDGAVKFTLKNTGASDMTELAEYVIIEDQIIFMQGSVQLDAGEDSIITVPTTPNGKSYYLRMDQAKGHPRSSHPSATVQGCGGIGGINLLMQLPQNQGENTLATYCDEVRGSFDPNDKQGFPLGWQEQHFIERGQDLDYMIRFQNTGNDTAFLVVLRDTLTSLLDVGSVRPGTSSHPYTFERGSNGALTFYFPHILLPDSNTNEVASHGYVRFRVSQQPGLPLGSRIENRAGIYFDFNAPVMTNTTFHTVGERLISFTVDRPANLVGLSILPNPMADEAIFRLQTPVSGADFRLSLFDATGRIVRDEMFAQPEHRFQRRGLLPGMYFFAVKKDGAVVASGRVVVR